jgi:hypothetical protein
MTTIHLKALHEQANNNASAFAASLAAYKTQGPLRLSVSDNTALSKFGEPFRLSTLSDTEFDLLCAFIRTTETLTDIHLNATLRNLSEERLNCLLDTLFERTNLRVLHLNHNGLGEPWLRLLSLIVQKNEQLIELDLSFNQLKTMNSDWMETLVKTICEHKTLTVACIEPDEDSNETYLKLLLRYASALPSGHFSNLGSNIADPELKKHYDAFVFALLTNPRIKTLEIGALPEDKDLFVDTLERNTAIHTATWIQAQRQNNNPAYVQHKSEKEAAAHYHDYYTHLRMSLIIARNYLLNHNKPSETLTKQLFIFLECYATLYLDTDDLAKTLDAIPIECRSAYQAVIERCDTLYQTMQQTLDEEKQGLYGEIIANAQEQHHLFSKDTEAPLERAHLRAWLAAPTQEKKQKVFLRSTLKSWQPRTVNLCSQLSGTEASLTPDFFRAFRCKHTIISLEFSALLQENPSLTDQPTEHMLDLNQLPSDTFDALCLFIETLPHLRSIALNASLAELTHERTEHLLRSLARNNGIRHIHLQYAAIGLKRETTQRALVQLVQEKPGLVTLELRGNHLFDMSDAVFADLVEALAFNPSLDELSVDAAESPLSQAKFEALTKHAANLPCANFDFSLTNDPLYLDFLAAFLQNRKITSLDLDTLFLPILDAPETLERFAKVFEKNTAVHFIDRPGGFVVNPYITAEEANYNEHSLYETHPFQTLAHEALARNEEGSLIKLKQYLGEFREHNARRTLSMTTSRNYLLHFGRNHIESLEQNTPLSIINRVIDQAFYFIASFYELYVETKLFDNHQQRNIPEDCQAYYCEAIDIAAQLIFAALKTKHAHCEKAIYPYDLKAHHDRLMMCALYLIRKNSGDIKRHKEVILNCASVSERLETTDTTDAIALAEKAEPEIQATHRNNQPGKDKLPKTHPYLKEAWLKFINGHSIVLNVSGAQQSRASTPVAALEKSASMSILNLTTEELLQERSKEAIKTMRNTLKALTEAQRTTLKTSLLTLTETFQQNHDPLFETLQASATHPEHFYFFTILQTGSSSGKPTLFHNTGSFNKCIEILQSGAEKKLSVVSPS